MNPTSAHSKFHRLKLQLRILFYFTSVILLFLVSCNLPTDPENPTNSSVTLYIMSANGVPQKDTYHTIGDTIKIKSVLKYPGFIDSLNISIFDTTTKTVEFTRTISTPADSEFIFYSFQRRSGFKKITATVYVNNKSEQTDFAVCTINPSSRKELTITTIPKDIIIAGDNCTLFVTINNPDSAQNYTTLVQHNGKQSAIANNTYIWSVPADARGYDTLTVTVSNSNFPSLIASDTVVVAISYAIPDAPSSMYVESRTTDSITLAWNRSLRAEFYQIYIADSLESKYILYKDSLKTISFTEKIKYAKKYYIVKAQNKAGVSIPSNMVSSDAKINSPPQWDITDTLKISLYQDSEFSLNLADTCSDPQKDSIIFILLPDALEGDTILGAVYSFTAPKPHSEPSTVAIVAQDPQRLSDTLYITFTITYNPKDPPPPPSNIIATYDTLTGTVTLQWTPVHVADMDGYIIYRNRTDSTTPSRINEQIVKTTTFTDTVFKNTLDTNNFTYHYQIKSQDTSANISSVFSDRILVSAASPTLVRTSMIFFSTSKIKDTVSINDPVDIIVHYTNKQRVNNSISWFIDSNTLPLRQTVLKKHYGTDTLHVVSNIIGTRKLTVRIDDEDASVWVDSTFITIVLDIPVAFAGNDTLIDSNTDLVFNGTATQKFGKFVKFRWDYDGNGSWDDSSDISPIGRHTFKTIGKFQTIFSVMDDDANESFDTVLVKVISGQPIASISNDTIVSINDPILVHGSGWDSLGTINKLEWDIGGNGIFIPAGRSDTTILAPAIATDYYNIILRITDDDNNIAFDTMSCVVLQDPPIVELTFPDTIALSSTTTASLSITQQFGSISNVIWDFKGTATAISSSEWGIHFTNHGTQLLSATIIDDDSNKTIVSKDVIVCTDPQNTISTPFTFSSAESPYIFTSKVTFNNIVTVEQGVSIVFQNGGSATLLNNIRFNGAVDDSIIVKGCNFIAPDAGSINLIATYCHFIGNSQNDFFNSYNYSFDTVSITNCTIERFSKLRFQRAAGDVILTNNHFSENGEIDINLIKAQVQKYSIDHNYFVNGTGLQYINVAYLYAGSITLNYNNFISPKIRILNIQDAAILPTFTMTSNYVYGETNEAEVIAQYINYKSGIATIEFSLSTSLNTL